jgi:hypothetical protein
VRLFLDHYVRAHGIVTAIVTGKDVRFQSAFWEAFTKAVDTKYKFIMAFYLQMDRLAETANDTLQMFLHACATADLNK